MKAMLDKALAKKTKDRFQTESDRLGALRKAPR